MTKDNEQYAYFTVVGSFDPGDITARVGLEPTESWRQGDVSAKTAQERRFSRWSLHSRLPHSEDLENYIADVLTQLDVNTEAFRAISLEHGGTMELVGYFYREYPGVSLGRDTVERLARYALKIDFDFYGLHCHHREDT